MNTLAFATSLRPEAASRRSPRQLLAEVFARERRLAIFGAFMLALLVPMALAAGLDERVLRGANVWIKPMKFALSLAVLAFTVAWFVGHLVPEQRRSRAVGWIVWLLIASGSFEVGYIALQAGLGQASHYNVGDVFHALMYSAMGVGALVLSATQPMLAWQLHRHAQTTRPLVYRRAVKLGLMLAFVFGAGVGGLLSGLQPPHGGAVVPLFGWSFGGGDLRPAHFVGLHAAQVLPLAGWALPALRVPHAGVAFGAFALAYTAVFAVLVAWGLQGRV